MTVACSLLIAADARAQAAPPKETKPAAPTAKSPASPAPGPTAAAPAPAPAPSGAPPTTAAPLPSTAGPVERCSNCHAGIASKRYLHPSLVKNDCTACHRGLAGEQGKCRSKTASKWALVKSEPDLCYNCHRRMDQSKSVHTAVRQGSCLSCHEAHSSAYPKLIRLPREKVCFECHESEPLLSKAVRHAPVAEGLCLDCHEAHGSAFKDQLLSSGTAYCQHCHDTKAPTGKGTPSAGYRVDLSLPVVHKVITQKNDCGLCHEIGHAGDNKKLLKKNMLDLCYGCHERQDKARYPHTALLGGGCVVCHDPHSSRQPKLLTTTKASDTCFRCHQDDLTGRKVIHKPLEKGCDQCHLPHGGSARNGLKGGEGKKSCYVCHQTPIDAGKVKHAALERYGCTGCHDPHGTANRFLIAKTTNELCASCHEAQKDGKHVSTLVARGHTVGGGKLLDPRKPDRPFSCASCHNPHGSDFPKLAYSGNTSMESCDGCHGDKSGKNPAMRNVISRSKKPGSEPSSGAAGSGGSGSDGSGSGGSGSGGPGPGAGSGAGVPGSGDGAPPAR